MPQAIPGSGALLGALASLSISACAHTVVAPANPARPVSTFLLDHGRHATVVIEHHDGLTRYSYGHWRYYAELQMGPTRASGAIIGSDQAALGRRQMKGPPDIDNIRRQIPVVTEAAWRIEVNADTANRLVGRLDSVFREQRTTRIENRLYDLEFVHHPDPYRLGHNSNHVAGEWLRALGCRVEMHGPLSAWRVGNAKESWSREQARQPGQLRTTHFAGAGLLADERGSGLPSRASSLQQEPRFLQLWAPPRPRR